MKQKKLRLSMYSLSAILIMAICSFGLYSGSTDEGLSLVKEALAAEKNQKVSPVKARDRDFYAPNSEDLGKNEMRVIACGTGMPTTRAAQAAASQGSLFVKALSWT